ncbi:MAG: hypothetical protein KKF62_06125 [Bacteroidetes bacterium]|nr:hypothetical protein [Bacteroidota bacterium]MBU1113591.1 hypothetical protein [Bacteroidota bacterium]MBU1796967.1 hypothetical protein [Bacteroidota bacterium]
MKVLAKIDSNSAVKKIEKKDNIFSSKKLVNNIELLHLSYFLFKVEIKLKSKIIIQHICIDGLSGEYAFVQKEHLKFTNESDEHTKLILTESQASKIAKSAITAMLMVQKGKGANLVSIDIKLISLIKYPYWIGYYKRKNGFDFEVVDAVNGKKQGAKMKPVFVKLIMQ